jgi:predicted RNA-binding Zn-ribbon protein involved in translation (DUF1610 family)
MKCPDCGHQMYIKVVKVKIVPISLATRDEPHYVCPSCGKIIKKD